MKKYFILFSIMFTSTLMACDCSVPKKILEFLDSEYVFQGVVVDKKYSNDSLTYEATIGDIRHYKKNPNNPSTLKFTFKSEFNKIKGSCDFSIKNNDFLLIYAKKNQDKLSFNLYCSNSKKIRYGEISADEKSLLERSNDFKFSNYIFENQSGFSYSKSITNIDSLITQYDTSKYLRDDYNVVIVDIDENGNLSTANLLGKKNIEIEVVDNIFDLNYMKNLEYRIPDSQFEKDILEIARNIKKWESFIHKKSLQKVRHRKYLKFYIDSEGILVCEY